MAFLVIFSAFLGNMWVVLYWRMTFEVRCARLAHVLPPFLRISSEKHPTLPLSWHLTRKVKYKVIPKPDNISWEYDCLLKELMFLSLITHMDKHHFSHSIINLFDCGKHWERKKRRENREERKEKREINIYNYNFKKEGGDQS